MNNTSSEIRRPGGGRRRWFLAVVAALVVLGIGFAQLKPELEQGARTWLSLVFGALGVLLVLIWFLLLSRYPLKVRGYSAAAIAAIAVLISQTVRVTGSLDATSLPRLGWRWTKTGDLTPSLPVPGPATTAGAPAATQIPEVPQFFGPQRDGTVRGAGLAREWRSAPPKQLWRQAIGSGWSSFAVAGGRAFTQEQRGESEAVSCYDVMSGKLVWLHTQKARFEEWQGGEGPRATPAVDRGLVFASGATGILVCLEAATGRRVWSREVLREYHLANLQWGVSASPLVYDETVVVTGGNSPGPTLLAYRRTTGEPLWRSGAGRASYSSPLLATLAGRRVVLAQNAAALTAHDPASGELLLEHAWASDRNPRAAQPVVLEGDRVFLSAGYGMGCLLLQIKAGAGGRLEAERIWKTTRMRNQFNSVAAREGYLYGLDDGVLACVEIGSGERKWREGRYGGGQTLLVDDLIVIQSEPGPVALAEAKPGGFRETGRLAALASKTWNYPVLAGRHLLVRNDREAVCYELPLAAGR
jgi:outer membrane protein assembly factor BamB